MSSEKDSVKDEDVKVEEEISKDEVEETKNGADEKSSDESSEKGKKVPPKKRATKAKESKKEVKKEDNKRKEKKKEAEDDGDDEDDEAEDSTDTGAQEAADSNKVPLLDQPLELEGTRERKKVQRFTEDFKAESQSFVPVDIPKGKGDCLGDIPCINAYLQSYKVESLKPLHRLLFGRLGKTQLIKKNIKQFNGFEYAKGSEAYEKKRIVINKLDMRTLKIICSVLDLEKKGSRDELATRIAEYLVCPKDSGRPAPVSRPKRSSAQKANKRGFSESEDEYEYHPKSRRGRGKHISTKESESESEEKSTKMASSRRRRKAESDTEGKESEQEEPEVETGAGDDQDDVEQDGHSDTEESDEPKSKKKGKSNANANAKKVPNKKSSSKKAPNKKAEKKQSGKKRKEKDDKSEGNESSEDEPLSKKSKNPPTDDEIKSYVKEILEGANLEEITMKTVCKQVYGHYPDFDLSHKKDFIKTTVKSLISP